MSKLKSVKSRVTSFLMREIPIHFVINGLGLISALILLGLLAVAIKITL